MGAGLYTLVGLASRSAGSLLPLAFLVAGVAACFSVYSYAKLSVRYPSRGGAAEFLIAEFGDGMISGGLNVFQYVGYLIATALYAAGFSEYVRAFAGPGLPSWGARAVGAGVVLIFAGVNFAGSKLVGGAETWIVAIEVAILVAFVALGLSHADPSRLSTAAARESPESSPAGVALRDLSGLRGRIDRTGDMKRPRRDLPRAMFAALGVVALIYIVVSSTLITVLPLHKIIADAGHALADGGRSVAGETGFIVVGAAALLATASAVNATIDAASNIAFDVSQRGQLPRGLMRSLPGRGTVALVVSAALIVILVVSFP